MPIPQPTLRRKRHIGAVGATMMKKKLVRFAGCDSYGPARAPLTAKEIDDVWFTDEEHEGMRLRAREDCWKMMAEVQRRTRHTQTDSRCPQHVNDDSGPSCYRGLEARLSFQRAHDRRVAIQAVLEVQSRLRDGRAKTKHDPALVLGMLAAKLTADAGRRARDVGEADFRAVHGIAAGPQGPTPLHTPSVTERQARKRTIERTISNNGDSQDGEGRRVRMRVVHVEAAAS